MSKCKQCDTENKNYSLFCKSCNSLIFFQKLKVSRPKIVTFLAYFLIIAGILSVVGGFLQSNKRVKINEDITKYFYKDIIAIDFDYSRLHDYDKDIKKNDYSFYYFLGIPVSLVTYLSISFLISIFYIIIGFDFLSLKIKGYKFFVVLILFGIIDSLMRLYSFINISILLNFQSIYFPFISTIFNLLLLLILLKVVTKVRKYFVN